MTRTPRSRWQRALKLWSPDARTEAADEVRFHLEMYTSELEAEGLPPDEALREARRRFGDPAAVERWLLAHERRRAWRSARTATVDAFVQDLRHAVRQLRSRPGFALAVAGMLAFGIGAAATMFALVDAALLRPLPFGEDHRLVVLEGVRIPFVLEPERTAADIDHARELDVFESVSAYAPGALNLGAPDAAVRARVGVVTPGFFETLGVPPRLGRSFLPAEGDPDAARVAVLAHGTWRRYFGADPGVLGTDVELNGRPYQVVGVMPAGFGFPADAEVWIPLRLPYGFDDVEPFRGYLPSVVIARLARGATRDEAGARVLELLRRWERLDRPVTASAQELVRPLREHLVGSRRTALLVLLGATGLVLLVACANASGLLLARASTRHGELALRTTLGGSRVRIVGQLVVESVLLAFAGGAFGAALAFVATDALGGLLPTALSGTQAPRVDVRVLAFSLAVVVAAAVGCGLWPAVAATRAAPASVMRRTEGAGQPRETVRTRRAFVVTQLALATMLVIGAGLMLRSLTSLLSTDPGLRPERLATLELSLAAASYRSVDERRAFVAAVLDRLRATPGVESAAFVNELPLRGVPSIHVVVGAEGAPPPPVEEAVFAQLLLATDDYFRAMGIPLLRGRGFSADTTGDEEVIVNEALARRLWPGQEPVGQRIAGRTGAERGGLPGRTVVGVVGSVSAMTLESSVGPQMYQPLAPTPPSNLALVSRGDLPAAALARALRQAVADVDSRQAVYNVRTMEEVIRSAIAPRRTNTVLISLFGAAGLALAAVGVYGVLAFAVSRRTRELGIRIALGARSADVVALVTREGIALVAAGVLLGLAGAWALRHVLESLLWGVTVEDPVTWVAAPLVLVAAAALATVVPAWRAARVDPLRAIRTE